MQRKSPSENPSQRWSEEKHVHTSMSAQTHRVGDTGRAGARAFSRARAGYTVSVTVTDDALLGDILALVARQERSTASRLGLIDLCHGFGGPEITLFDMTAPASFTLTSPNDPDTVRLGWQRSDDGTEAWTGDPILVELSKFSLRCGASVSPAPGQTYEVAPGEDHGRDPLDVLAAAYSVIPKLLVTPTMAGMPFFYDREDTSVVF